MNKLCRECGNYFSIDSGLLVKNSSCSFGLDSWCIMCKNNYIKKWKNKNKEKLSIRRKELYIKNRDKIRETHRQRLISSPLINRAKISLGGMKETCKKSNIPLKVDWVYLADLIHKNPTCECCKVNLILNWKFDGKINNNCLSFDRFIPNKGYVPGNISILCWRCNNLKRDATSDQLRRIADWMDNKIWGNEVENDIELR